MVRRLAVGVLLAGVLFPHAGTALAGHRAAQITCTALSFGAAPTTASISAAGEVDCYTFTGAVGDRIRTRVAETSGALEAIITVVRPNTTTACGPTKSAQVDCSVNAAGTWTITVKDSSGSNTGNYSIAIQKLNNPTGCSAITFGAAPTAATISAAAEMDCYTFTGAVGDQVRVRVAKTSGTLAPRTDVVKSDGTLACGATTGTDLTCAVTVAGTHRIFVADNLGAHTGDYAIAAQRLNNPLSCTSITFGAAPTAASISAAAELDCYTFTVAVAVGDQIRVRLVTTAGTAVEASLFRPAGTSLCTVTDPITCQADAAGTYTVLVDDTTATATGSYVVAIQRLNNPLSCTSINFGAGPLSGTVGVGEIDCFTFNGNAGDQIRLRSFAQSNLAQVTPRFVEPGGGSSCSGFASSSPHDLTCQLDTTGTQKLLVESTGNTSSTYDIALQRLNNPSGCIAVGFGQSPAAGSITVPTKMDCYTFTASAGDEVRIAAVETSGNLPPNQALFDRFGTELDCHGISNQASYRDCTISSAGTQTILVDDVNNGGAFTDSYAVAIQRLNNPVGCTPLSFGSAPLAASIGAKGEMDCYTFSGSVGNQIQVAYPVTSGSLHGEAAIYDSDGESACKSGVSSPMPPCGLSASGTHTIVVDGGLTFGETGNYSIAIQRLDNPVGCSALGIGAAPTAASIGASGEMDCYTFTGVVGAVMRIRLISTPATFAPAEEVVRTDGTVVCDQVTQDLGAVNVDCTLDSAGTHRIIVSDDEFGPATGNYSIALQRLSNPPSGTCTAATLGPAPIATSIGGPVEMDCYSFSGTAGDRIRLHMVGSSPLTPQEEILRPNGTTLCTKTGIFTDVTCQLDTTGTARVLVYDQFGDDAGSYSFALQRLNAPAGCTALSFGAAPVSGNIAALGQLDCFTVAAAAGDRLRLRTPATSGTLAPLPEIVRPNGTTFSCATCALDATGTYAILLSDGNAGGIGGYAIAVQRLNNPVGCTPIAFGAAPLAGSLANGAAMACFTFTGALADRIAADTVRTAGAGALHTDLVGPTGKTVCQYSPSVYACGITTAGTEALIVDANGGGADYAISLQRLNSPVGCTPLSFGSPPTAGTIGAAAENDCFTFTGAPGDALRIHPIATTGALSPVENVARPDGTLACGHLSGTATCRLDETGTFTIVLVDFNGTGAGDYGLEIQRLNAPVGCAALTTGVGANDSIDAAAEFDCFTFSGNAGTTAAFTLAVNSGTLAGKMEVIRPNGTSKCTTSAATLSCSLDVTGTYTVLVSDQAGTHTGAYTLTRTS